MSAHAISDPAPLELALEIAPRPDLRADPRVVALVHSLEDWLPSSIAYERAMNAAAPLLLLESLQVLITPLMVLDPEEAIASALSNPCAMHGVLAPPERVQAAARAWLRTSPCRTTPCPAQREAPVTHEIGLELEPMTVVLSAPAPHA